MLQMIFFLYFSIQRWEKLLYCASEKKKKNVLTLEGTGGLSLYKLEILFK